MKTDGETPPASAMLLRTRALALRDLACAEDTAEARAEIEASLVSKWWGLRVLAIRVLGRWGGKADKAWLVERARRPMPSDTALRRGPARLRWQMLETREARLAVARLIDATDWTWMLDLSVNDPGYGGPDVRRFARIPDAPIETFIERELARDEVSRIKLLLRTVFALRLLACRRTVLERCARHVAPDVARQARHFLELSARMARL